MLRNDMAKNRYISALIAGMKSSPFVRRLQTFRGYSRKKKIIIIGSILLLIAIVIPIATYAYYARDIADRERLMNRNNTGVILLDKNGEEFYSRGEVKDFKEVSLTQMAPHVPKALIAAEDKNFYSDPGFSPTGVIRALFSNIKEQDLSGSGGSGITQQLVKNNLLTSDKNYLRKYQELSMAIAIERQYTKEEILEMYLNSVYFGNDAFGIETAAKSYFNKSAKDLSLAESAMLIGLLPAPSAYSPITGDVELAKVRQAYVLERMAEEGFITDQEKTAATEAALTYLPAEEDLGGVANHFAVMVIEELNKKYGEERVTRSGFRVQTTLDLTLQKHAEEAVKKQIAALSARDARNGSLIAVDPNTGEIRAMVGSADWGNNEFGKVNMTTVPRQPGSSFKPIYYAEALATKKITAATIIEDKATDFGNYAPTNYDFKYRGDVTVRYALANSLNIPAVKVMQKVGVAESVQVAQRMGLDAVDNPEKYGLSLALGTAETSLLNMTNAYAAFAKNGLQYNAATIHKIEDKFDDTVFENKPKSKRVMDDKASYILSSILSDEAARAPLAGSRFNIGRPVAVKTGTTNDNRDAWTIGYTPQIAVGVWVGNNDSTPMRGVGGSLGAGPIWRSAITSFLKNTKTEQFVQPSGVVRVPVCSSELKGQEVFIRGTEAPFVCKKEPPKEVDKKPDEEEKKDDKKQNEQNQEENTDTGNGGEENTEEEEVPPEEEEPTEPPIEEPPEEEEDPTTPPPPPTTTP